MADNRYYVLVKLKKGGAIQSTPWDDEREAKSSANALVTLGKNPAAIVVHNGVVIYDRPHGILERAPQIAREFQEQPLFKGKTITCSAGPVQTIPSDKEMFGPHTAESPVVRKPSKKPATGKKPAPPTPVTTVRSPTADLLYAACTGAAMATGQSPDKAKGECDGQECNIDCLAASVDNGEISINEAYSRVVKATGCLYNTSRPAAGPAPVRTKAAGKLVPGPAAPVAATTEPLGPTPVPTLEQVYEYQRNISPALLYEGTTKDLFLLRQPVKRIDSGIVFLVTEESGEALNRILCEVNGSDPEVYAPQYHLPAPGNEPGYRYMRPLDLVPRSKHDPTWVFAPNKWVPHPMAPTDLIARVQAEFPEDQVKIITYPGIVMA